ncbi:MAG: tetratricopeptide repeat protein [Rhodospirillaceae bacterium]
MPEEPEGHADVDAADLRLNVTAEALVARARRDAADKAVQVETLATLAAIGAFEHGVDLAHAALSKFPESPAVNLAALQIFTALKDRAAAADTAGLLCRHRPDSPGAWQRWAIHATAAGRHADARVAFKAALAQAPRAAILWNGLADAAIQCGDLAEAEAALRQSLTLEAGQAPPAGQLGRLLMKRGALGEAEEWMERSIASDPTLTAVHVNLAAVRLRLKRPHAALAAAAEAVRLAPNLAGAHAIYGQVLVEIGRYAQARTSFRIALACDPANAEAAYGLARALAKSGHPDQAVAAADAYLALRPNDAQAAHMRRAWARERVTSAPDDYIRTLFDGVADQFDAHLEGALAYDAPQRAAALLKEIYPAPDHFRKLCDIGCGTGLMAKALADHYAIPECVGVDLSPRMIAQARTKSLYSELIAGEGVATLARMDRSFDLITALDMLIYVGDAGPFMREAARRLARGGALALSLETADDIADVRLELTARFSHNKAHVIAQAQKEGLCLARGIDVTLRREGGADVKGYIAVFERR